uniref:Teratocyte uncharacterized V n=1 Tax=Cotesia flavipes TaxID=89805 RepID=A0A8K1YTW2_COTFL|nr:teratocyte uncharacterized V [Cotesia flavipes]
MAKIVLIIELFVLMSLIAFVITQTHQGLSKDELKLLEELFRQYLTNNIKKSNPKINFPTAKTEKITSFKNLTETTTQFPVPTYNYKPMDYSWIRSGGQSAENIDSNSTDWLKRSDLTWAFPIYQLTNSKIPSRRYNRTFRCTGILVLRNAVLAPRLCIDDDAWYVVATSLRRVSSFGSEFLRNVHHRRLYPAVNYQSYRMASIEYKEKLSDTIIIKNDTIPGMVLLFFDMEMNSKLAWTYDSPQFYQIYSKERNPNCVRTSMMKNAKRQILVHQTPEKILKFVNYLERYKRFKHSTHDNKTTGISWIEYDSFTPVFGTEQHKSSDLQPLLGSALVCKGQNDVPVLTGVLISTSYDGFNLYALVGGMNQWLQNQQFEFQRRTDRLFESNTFEIYEYDLS